MPEQLTHESVQKLISAFSDEAKTELNDRWSQWKIDHKQIEVHEVVGSLLARQVTLVTHFAHAFPMWSWSMAPLILRPVTEVYLNLKWILDKPVERSRAFIAYGLGQQKLYVEHLKAQKANATGDEADDLDRRIKACERWIDSQLQSFLVGVNLAKWGENQREMAIEAGELEFYNYAHAPLHGGVHSMWQHVGIYNLKDCTNPLHCQHKIPDVPNISPDLSFVLGAAHYLEKTFQIFDAAMGIKARVPSACENLIERFNPRASGHSGSDAAGSHCNL